MPSGRWQGIRARVGGKRPTQTFATRGEAEAWASGAGGWLPDVLTLGVWLNRWLALAWPRLRPSTRKNYRRFVLACAPLAGRPVAEITTDACQALTNELLERWARSHVAVWRNVVSSALRRAVPRYLQVNPMADVRLPRAVDQPVKAWRRDEVARLLAAAAGGPHEVWLLLALGTGARLGELRALEWSDVDLRARTIRISKSLDTVTNQLGPTKSGRHRTVDLPDELVPVLTAHRARQAPADRLVCGNGQRAYRANTYRAWLVRACRRAGVTVHSPHAARHTACSLMLMDGVSPTEAAATLGHASVATVYKIYAHFINASERRGAKALGSVLRPREPMSSVAQSERPRSV